MQGSFDNIKIQGICSCVPSTIEKNEIFANIIGDRRTKKQIKLTGVSQRHISNAAQMPSDLCYSAAVRLLSHLKWKVEDIKVLILITQRPNFKLPSTAFFLHKRLGLPKDCLCFDLNLGCSSFNVGIQTIASLMQNCDLNDKALLMVGDTAALVKSPDVSYKDDEIAHDMLFGSEGTCIALEKVEKSNIMFMNKSDGEGYQAIMTEFGEPSRMDGSAVFSFAIGEVTKTVNDFRNHFNISEESIDYYVFHQAQQMILDTIIDICNIPPEKELRSLYEYGNTSGGSVPLTLNANTDAFADKTSIRVLFCGFGVGLSWGCIYAEIPTANILPVFETDEHFRDARTAAYLHNRNILVYNADSKLGEWASKHLKRCGGKLALVGSDYERLSAIIEPMIDKPITITDMDNPKEKLESDEFKINSIVFIGSVSVENMERYVSLLSETLDNSNIGAVVICDSYNNYNEMEQSKEKISSLFSHFNSYENIRVNAVLYNKNNVEIIQIRDSGQEWVNQFVSRGCPDEMVKASYVSANISHFLSGTSKYTNNSIISIE